MASSLEVFVEVSSKEKIALEVYSTDSIANLKNEIKDKKGFPVKKQRIFYRGDELNDHRTVSDYNIQDQSTLNLILEGKLKYPVEMTILSAARRQVTLAVNAIDSISEVKLKIQHMTGAPPHKQILFFAAIELENTYNITGFTINELFLAHWLAKFYDNKRLYNVVNATRSVSGLCPWSIRVQTHGWLPGKFVSFVVFNNLAGGPWKCVRDFYGLSKERLLKKVWQELLTS